MKKKNELDSELADLRKREAETRDAFNKVREAETKIRSLKKSIESLAQKKQKEESDLTVLCKSEITMCGKFSCFFKNEYGHSLLVELSDLLAKIKKEISFIDVETVKKEKVINDELLEKVYQELNEINIKLQELEKQAIFNARIVGTTLAKTYLSETLRERKFDTVILDEASMASIPALWCASYLAEKNIVIVGDFLQLPPIVMAETPLAQKWLGQDIFHHSGMQALAKKEKAPSNFVMLNKQFRMESDIAELANNYYGDYGGLQSDDSNEKRVKKRKEFYSWYSGKDKKKNVHLIDTKNLHAWVTGVPQGKKHSRLNYFSASVCVELAFKFIENKLNKAGKEEQKKGEEPSVLIVAPYKPHTSRIKHLIELEYENRGFKDDPGYIGVGTVHSMQGSEADIVIFDLVVDEPHWRANLFMPNDKVDLNKQFNVAITRAKFKLYVVGNFDYCMRHATNGNALSEFLRELINKRGLKKLDAKELLPKIRFVKENEFDFSGNISSECIKCTGEAFDNYFRADIQHFQKRLVIYSPFMTENRLGMLLPQFADRIREGKQIVVITKAMSDRSPTQKASYQKMEKKLTDVGVKIIHKKGMHEKLIFVDDEVFWIGSLNALSFTGETGEIMMRYSDKEHGIDNLKLHEIGHLCEVAESENEQECPVCKSEMVLKEGNKGRAYWFCEVEGYSRNTDQPYSKEGILRCRECGSPYVFKMKNQPRWVCVENSRHYKEMSANDLKLPKMVEMLSKTDRKRVEKYFQEKQKEETKNTTAKGSKKGKIEITGKSEAHGSEQISLFD